MSGYYEQYEEYPPQYESDEDMADALDSWPREDRNLYIEDHENGQAARPTRQPRTNPKKCRTCGNAGHDSRNCAINKGFMSKKKPLPLQKSPNIAHEKACGACREIGHDRRGCPKLLGMNKQQQEEVVTTVTTTTTVKRATAKLSGVKSAILPGRPRATITATRKGRKIGKHAEESNLPKKTRGRPPVKKTQVSGSKTHKPSGSDDTCKEWRRAITGIYVIKFPTAEKEWPDFAEATSIRLHVDGETIWGEFDSGCYEGYIRLDPTASSVIPDSKMRFEWKGNNMGSGAPRSGEGELILSRVHDIEGAFFGMYGDSYRFEGKRKFMPCVSGRSSDYYALNWRSWDGSATHW
ncbi:hypothetical protein TWF694_004388 [Orbilia ellipsospora]|uniref:CCHC-type domain-containing protein n=1 Tax=Orbilia ellipsospora TaxID=2528407 RepID=A0AAV9X145_9PEZI